MEPQASEALRLIDRLVTFSSPRRRRPRLASPAVPAYPRSLLTQRPSLRTSASLTLVGLVLLFPLHLPSSTCQAFLSATCVLPEVRTARQTAVKSTIRSLAGFAWNPILQLRNLFPPKLRMGMFMTRASAAKGKNSEMSASAGQGEVAQSGAPDEISWAQKKRKRVKDSEHEPTKKRVRSSLSPEGGVGVSAASDAMSDSSATLKKRSPLKKTGKREPAIEMPSGKMKVKKEASPKKDPVNEAGEKDIEAGKKKPKAKQKVKEEAGSVPAEISPPEGWKEIYDLVVELRKGRDAPVDWAGSEALGVDTATNQIDKFHVLIALMLSSQTKDQVVAEAVLKLKARGLSVQSIIDMPAEELDSMIAKVGFHNNKTKYIKQTALILRDKHDGQVPTSAEELCALPGIGPKMAYIILAVAHGIVTGIGVDTHMHRIFNQLGWVKSKTPEQTRAQIEAWLPLELWGEVNLLFVGFGQMLQQPVERAKLLRLAIASPNASVALRLIARLGGDVHVQLDKESKLTALMHAAEVGAAEAVKTLVELGANVGHKDAHGQTAQDMAAAAGHASVQEFLGRKGTKKE